MDQNRSSKNVWAKVKTSPKCRRQKCLFAKKVTLASRISLTHMLLVEHQKQNQMSHRVRVIQKQLLTMKKNFEDSNNHSPFHFFLSPFFFFFFFFEEGDLLIKSKAHQVCSLDTSTWCLFTKGTKEHSLGGKRFLY